MKYQMESASDSHVSIYLDSWYFAPYILSLMNSIEDKNQYHLKNIQSHSSLNQKEMIQNWMYNTL